jgi:hypothetical protein
MQGETASHARVGWRRWLSADRVIVGVALLGIVIALVVAMWPGD